MESENEITVMMDGDVAVFNIRGDMTVLSEPYLLKTYERAGGRGVGKLILAFNDDIYINSGGIVALSHLLMQAKANNQQVAITGISNHFKKIFAMVGISKFAAICDTVEQALSGFVMRDS